MNTLEADLTNTTNLANNTNSLDSAITSATNTLWSDMKTVKADVIDGLITPTTDQNVQANNKLDDVVTVDLTGIGKFNPAITAGDVALGGDLAGLTVQYVNIVAGQSNAVNVALSGALNYNTGMGTINFDANSFERPGTAIPLSDSITIYSESGSTTNGAVSSAVSNLTGLTAQATQLLGSTTLGSSVGNCSSPAIYNNLENNVTIWNNYLSNINAALADLEAYTTMIQNSIFAVNAVKVHHTHTTTGSAITGNSALTSLNSEITTAAPFASTVYGTDPGQCGSASALTALNSILVNAEAIAASPYSTDNAYITACAELQQALATVQTNITN